jgi:hypothetical protein
MLHLLCCFLQVQQDEKVPRLVDSFKGRMMVMPEGVVSGLRERKENMVMNGLGA